MTTFDLAEVRAFTAELTGRLAAREHVEGTACADLDAALRHHAGLCREFRTGLRDWYHAIFTARTEFDAAVEKVWLAEGHQLRDRLTRLAEDSDRRADECYDLPGLDKLKAALWELNRWLDNWVPPQKSASPSARVRLTAEQIAAGQKILATLPKLPADWLPDDPEQRERYLRLRALRRPS